MEICDQWQIVQFNENGLILLSSGGHKVQVITSSDLCLVVSRELVNVFFSKRGIFTRFYPD